MSINWHTLSPLEAEQRLGTSIHNGLSQEEAQRRFRDRGPNELPVAKPDPLPLIFFRQFQSPLIYVLFFAAVVVFLMGEVVDAALILGVLVINAVTGAFQEGKAQNTLFALRRFTETNATVVRGGEEIIIPDREVVSGDVLILQEGEKVPADARVVEERVLRLNEAALTGESVPVHKGASALQNPALPQSERRNMVFKGTNVTGGNGKALVVATGLETIIGQISKEVAAIDTEIPLKKDIRWLSRMIVQVIGVVSIGLFAAGIYFGKPLREMLATVVSLAVSIIPEGLPVVLTLVLASGVWRMAKRQAVVKKLQAVEALGQAKVIAVDKTGTITQNELIVKEVFVGWRKFGVGGTGYEPKGEIRLSENIVDPANHAELLLAGKIAAFCANARAVFWEETKTWKVSGDPTEAALAVFGEKMGFHKADLERESPLLHETPFDYDAKYHLTVHLVENGQEFVAVTGAPESILDITQRVFVAGEEVLLTPEKRAELLAIFEGMSGRGLRVVAFSYFVRPKTKNSEEVSVSLEGLVFGGFYGMSDSMRPEVPEAVRRARAAGMKIVMITGDHKLAAVAIAREAGIWEEGSRVLTGGEIDALPEEVLASKLEAVAVFARVTPEHKLKIIKAYRKRGEIIAMTGDGVNDAPSLVAADLGVAMGKIGTEVAKEAADIVLLDDNFGSIVAAAEEGRSVYKTIKKVVLYLFSTGLGELFVIAGALFSGYPLPLLPAHIIWLNFVTDGFQDIALGLEPKEEKLLEEKFERPTRWIVDRLMGWRMIVMAVPMAVGSLYIFEEYLGNGAGLAKAQTMVLTVLAAFQWINAWNCRSEKKSVFGQSPLTNKFLLVTTIIVVFLHILIIYHPPLQEIMGTVSLTLKEWGIILLMSLSVLVAEEARKAYASAKERQLEGI